MHMTYTPYNHCSELKANRLILIDSPPIFLCHSRPSFIHRMSKDAHLEWQEKADLKQVTVRAVIAGLGIG